MKRPDRDARLRLDILRLLEACDGYLLPQSTLHGHLCLLTAPPPAPEDSSRVLGSLAAQSLILSVPSALDGELRWRITDTGRALLLEFLRA